MLIDIANLMHQDYNIYNINIAGILEKQIGVRYTRDKRPYCGLVLSTGGEYIYHYEKSTFPFSRNEIIYLPANSSYFHVFSGEKYPIILDNHSYHTLIVNFDLYDEKNERIYLDNKPTILPVNGEKYQSFFIDLFRQQTGIHTNPTRVKILIYQLLSALGEECHNINLTEQYAELIPVLRYIQTHPIGSIQVNDLIQACYISPTKFRKLFHSCEGVTPQEYLTCMALDSACRLLGSTTLSVKDISIRLGYSSPANFTKFFKKYKYISPKEYRKLYAPQNHTM